MKTIIYLALLLFISFTLSSCNQDIEKSEKEYNNLVSFVTNQNIEQATILFNELEKTYHDNPRKVKIYYDEVLKINVYINSFLAEKNEIIKNADKADEFLWKSYKVYMDSIIMLYDDFIKHSNIIERPNFPLMDKNKLSFNEMMLNISYYKVDLIKLCLGETSTSYCGFGIVNLETEESLVKDGSGYSFSVSSSLFNDSYPFKFVYVDSIVSNAELTPKYYVERKSTFAHVGFDSLGKDKYDVYIKVLGITRDGSRYEEQLKHVIDNRDNQVN